jgi:hypothetical protein
MAVTFKQLFCSKHNCPEHNFSRQLLEMSLYPHARAWLRILSFFEVSSIVVARQLIEEIGECTSPEEIDDAITEYQRRLNRDGGLLVHKLKLRISCGRLLNIYRSMASGTNSGQLELFRDQGKIIPLIQQSTSPVAVDF